MKYAVESKIFNNGKAVVKVRPARDGEEDSYSETRSCDIYIDVFDSKEDAEAFYRQY